MRHSRSTPSVECLMGTRHLRGYAKSEIAELSDWPNGILQRGSEVCIGGNNGKTQNTVISSTGTTKWLKDKQTN